MNRRNPSGQRGAVFIVASLAFAFLALVAGALLLFMTSEQRAHALWIDRIRAEYGARAGAANVEYLASYLGAVDGDFGALALVNLRSRASLLDPRRMAWGEMTDVSVEDEQGKMYPLTEISLQKALFAHLCDRVGCGKWRDRLLAGLEHPPFFSVGDYVASCGLPAMVTHTLSSLMRIHGHFFLNVNTAGEPILRVYVAAMEEKYRRFFERREQAVVDAVAGKGDWVRRTMIEQCARESEMYRKVKAWIQMGERCVGSDPQEPFQRYLSGCLSALRMAPQNWYLPNPYTPVDFKVEDLSMWSLVSEFRMIPDLTSDHPGFLCEARGGGSNVPGPPPTVNILLSGRPWKYSALMNAYPYWIQEFRINEARSHTLRIRATRNVRRAACTYTMVVDVDQSNPLYRYLSREIAWTMIR